MLIVPRKPVVYFLILFITLLGENLYAQVPVISYTPSTNVYTVGTAITPLVPTNTGGAITTATFPTTSISGPSGMAINPVNGDLYVTQYGGPSVTYYTSAGVYVNTFGTGYTNPDGIAFDAAGNAYIVDTGSGNVYKITPGLVKTTIITGLNSPLGIGIDASGNLYVTNSNSNQVKKYTYNTWAVALTITEGGGSTPSDVRVDASGSIYVLNYGSKNVIKYSSAGASLGVFAPPAGSFNGPYALAIGPTGNVYVGDSGNNIVDIYSSAGVLLNTISVTDPEGLTVDGSGDVFVSSYGGNKIYEFPPLGGYVLTGTLPTGLSFNTTTGTISGTPTATSAATNYTVTAYNYFGSGSTVVNISVGTAVAWLGFISSAWLTGSNWSTGSPPGVNDFVSIGVSAYTGSKKEPLITTAVTVSTLTFGNNGGNHTLTLTSPGLLTIGTSLTIPTTVTTTITGTGSINIAPVAVINITGSGVLNTTLTGTLTLKSDATGSASLGQVLTTSIIGSSADSIHVERYITGGVGYRGYRLLSSPVYSATVSGNKVYGINFLSNSVYLTGNAGGGFNKTSNPTLYLFREDQAPNNTSFTSGNFWGISAINNVPAYNYYMNGSATVYNIPAGNGVMFFFRGNRAATTVAAETLTSYNAAPTVTLSAYGILTTGQVIVHDWYTPASANLGWTNATANTAVRGFNLVGNPYASSIDWETYNTSTTTTGIYANNVGNTIYELNPATNNYDTYQKGGTFTNHGTRTIVSGQGFFVLAANNTSPQLIFNESAKVTTQNTGLNLFMATKDEITNQNNANIDRHLRIQIAADSVNTDDMYIGFSSGASAQFADDEDAPYKSGNGMVKIASYTSDNVKVAINRMPLPGQQQATIPLFATANAYGVYKLNLKEIAAIPQIYEVWLMDHFKHDSLDMRHNATYLFNITTDTGSYGAHRFKLVIRQNPALGLHLLSFTAEKSTGGGAQVVWTTANEQNYTNFSVERSTDNGATFDVLGGFASGASGTYSFLDYDPVIGANQYRLKLEDLNGAVTYSNIVTLMYNNISTLVKNSVAIYPNPAKSTLNLTISPPFASGTTQTGGPVTNPSGTRIVYGIRIVNTLGIVVQSANTTQLTWQTDVSNLLPGTYILQVVNSYNNSLIGKGTFVKL